MNKKEVWQSASWTLKMLATALLGLLWVLGPSIIVYHVGMTLSPFLGWHVNMIQVAATNAFIIWCSVQVLFILFDRYMDSKIRIGIEKYHEEFTALKKRYYDKGGTNTDSDITTMKDLKLKMILP